MSLQMMEKIRGHSLISYEVSSYIYQLLLSGITLDKCIFSMLQPKGRKMEGEGAGGRSRQRGGIFREI